MDWKAVIAELQKLGATQVQIAEACGCRQASVSELARGVTKDPRHSLGVRLLALLEEKRAAAAADEGRTHGAPAGGAALAAEGAGGA